MVTLLRRYPLTKAGEAGPGGSGNLSTGHDEEQCTLDFATGTSAQVRAAVLSEEQVMKRVRCGPKRERIIQILPNGKVVA